LQDLESIKQHRQEQPTLAGNPTWSNSANFVATATAPTNF
jgi:hypothetical protein